MSKLAEVTAFRIVQEAITNIQKHSQAGAGTVALEFADDRLLIDVRDDGVGFAPPERLALFLGESKLGMVGMEQRLLSIWGCDADRVGRRRGHAPAGHGALRGVSPDRPG